MERRIIDLSAGKYIKQIFGGYVEDKKESPTQNQQNQSEFNADFQHQISAIG
ncbi:hypothetical protein [Nostoc sp. LEGE 12450]|uniref:hypothetical protein n=1 Tax=Nostoc sp. LEGE 12450 TaxID=1828643 RepID=UPI00187E1AAD|nr:hypothetical protein [Nostoc sp. LEGE 12450]MBE8990134.1 hypothetical protein [Nostoc sp. LEGE 12450]